MRRSLLAVVSLALGISICNAGCGYTTKSLLPSNFKQLYVANFKNSIAISAEQSNMRMYRGYRPGMEIEITKAVTDKFIMDGNLKITTEDKADLALAGELVDFRREPLRYDVNDNIEEYRLKLIVNLELNDVKTGKTLWVEKGFAGETTYMTTGPLAKTDSTAVAAAMVDLARRIVERTIEAW